MVLISLKFTRDSVIENIVLDIEILKLGVTVAEKKYVCYLE